VRSCIFYLLSLQLYTKARLGELPKQFWPAVFPVIMLVISLLSLLFPLRQGRILLSSIGGVLAAPLLEVNFRSVLIGDLLTSLVRPLVDFVYSVCYISSGEWLRPDSKQGVCLSSSLYQDWVVPLVLALPLWFRFMQCLRLFHDTQQRVPALPNALKYAISMLVVLFGAVHPTLMSTAGDDGSWIHVGWFTTYLASTLYSFAWDVRMDWKLGCMGLRERLMFRSRLVYHAAIVIDLLLRFGWTATLVPHWISIIAENSGYYQTYTSHLVMPAVAAAEIGRRAMWAVFRLESEHLHNTEGFRRIDVIPLHFDHAPREDSPSQSSSTARRYRLDLLGELLVYTSVVVILGYVAVTSRPLESPDAQADPEYDDSRVDIHGRQPNASLFLPSL